MKTKIKAPAKVNLTLEIIKRLPNGYHALRSVMVKLDNLYDTIRLDFDYKRPGIFIQSNGHAIPLDENNIAYKSALKIYDCVGKEPRLKITIEKNIPVAAGLAGGSSDAAAVLLALNKHFGNIISQKELIKIGADIGKDVPFFISSSKVSLVSGMGEQLSSISQKLKTCFLIITPPIHVPTGKAYGMLSENLWFMNHKKRVDVSRKMAGAIKKNDVGAAVNHLYNDFELVAEKMHPIIKEIKMTLISFGARGALMSGSGSSVFGVFRSEKEAINARKILKKKYPNFFISLG